MNKLVNALTNDNARQMGSAEWKKLSKEEQSDWRKRAK